MVLAGEREKKEEYAKPRTEGREVSYVKIGIATMAVTQDLLSGMPMKSSRDGVRISYQYIMRTADQ